MQGAGTSCGTDKTYHGSGSYLGDTLLPSSILLRSVDRKQKKSGSYLCRLQLLGVPGFMPGGGKFHNAQAINNPERAPEGSHTIIRVNYLRSRPETANQRDFVCSL